MVKTRRFRLWQLAYLDKCPNVSRCSDAHFGTLEKNTELTHYQLHEMIDQPHA